MHVGHTSPSPSPRLRAGAERRRIRKTQGLLGVAVGAAQGWSQSKVSRIETGRFGATVWELAGLADFYGVPEEVRAEILAIAAEGSGLPGAWIVRAGGAGRRRGEVATIELRTRRFRKEAALLRSSPSAEVLEQQIEHLLRLSQLPGVDIRLLTASSVPSTAPMNSFVIYDSLSAESPSVVLVETQTANLHLSAKDDVSTYERTFEGLQTAALSPDPPMIGGRRGG
jgi:hypothetical protein